jgi:hypothetical protein
VSAQNRIVVPEQPGESDGHDVENPDYAAFARRIIRAHGPRIAEGDIESLPDLMSS